LQDVKDKAKAFIKRKVEQLTQEHAAALESFESRISLLTAARNSAERERDELMTQRDQLLEQLSASASSIHSSSTLPLIAPEVSTAPHCEEFDRLRSEVEVLRAQLSMSQRQHAEAVDAASAADIFRQKQLETEKAKYASELQGERMRAESALADAQARFSEALAEAKLAALNVAAADEKVATANDSTRILKERNEQLERESRELLQVKCVFLIYHLSLCVCILTLFMRSVRFFRKKTLW
jgi:hypothetical protein